MKKLFLLSLLLFTCLSALELGKVAPTLSISGEDGSILTGEAWSSKVLKGRVTLLFYVDPDTNDDNNPLAVALKKKAFPSSDFHSVAIVNLSSTWIPNILIESHLKSKQKNYPAVTYIKDKTGFILKHWNLKDGHSDVLLFNKNGKLLYQKFKTLSKEEISKVIHLIEAAI